jgi:Uma2 family endonuclease
MGTARASSRLRRWTRAEYERLVDRGVFRDDERLELLDGLLVVREPQGARHAMVVVKVRRALERAFGEGFHVRDHSPVALDRMSEPEPDLAVVPGAPDDHPGHPVSAVLIVEVAESSLSQDRLHKGSLYARARIPEYWVVNLIDGVLEVYRAPARSRSARYGWSFRDMRRFRRGEDVIPLHAPGARVPAGDLLPREAREHPP